MIYTYIGILLGAHYILNIRRIRVNTVGIWNAELFWVVKTGCTQISHCSFDGNRSVSLGGGGGFAAVCLGIPFFGYMTLRHWVTVSHGIIDSPLTHWLTHSTTLSESCSAPLQVFIPLFHLPFVCLFTFSPNHHLSCPAISVCPLPNFCLLPAPTDMLSTLVWSILITKCSLTNTDATRQDAHRRETLKWRLCHLVKNILQEGSPPPPQITNSREQNHFCKDNFASVKFPAFCKIRRFITAFTTAQHLSLSWERSSLHAPSRFP
jgi:hypothetical protein